MIRTPPTGKDLFNLLEGEDGAQKHIPQLQQLPFYGYCPALRVFKL